MNPTRVKSLLQSYTYLVWKPSETVVDEWPLVRKVQCSPVGLMPSSEAAARGLTLVNFPAIAVGVDATGARRFTGVFTKSLDLPPKSRQRKMTAAEIVGTLGRPEFDLEYKLRLCALGHVLGGWKLDPQGREVHWWLSQTPVSVRMPVND